MAGIEKDPLNAQAEALQEAETQLKLLAKTALVDGLSFLVANGRAREIIKKALAKVRSPTLRRDAYLSLRRFFQRIYLELRREIDRGLLIAALLILGIRRGEESDLQEAEYTLAYPYQPQGRELAERASRAYMRRVSRALKKLAKQRALDPRDVTGRNSLRNLAEMQVRAEAQERDLQRLRDSGVRLVVCSAHENCSDRCFPWQGRVYSLNGTTGTTSDGRKYIPLEVATDIYYTTKAGRVYKNGLLGFNCRHRLSPYKHGLKPEFVSEETQRREYAIDQRQRQYEREILHAREKALIFRGIDPEAAKKYQEQADRLNRDYIRYSRANGREAYPSRTKPL